MAIEAERKEGRGGREASTESEDMPQPAGLVPGNGLELDRDDDVTDAADKPEDTRRGRDAASGDRADGERTPPWGPPLGDGWGREGRAGALAEPGPRTSSEAGSGAGCERRGRSPATAAVLPSGRRGTAGVGEVAGVASNTMAPNEGKERHRERIIRLSNKAKRLANALHGKGKNSHLLHRHHPLPGLHPPHHETRR